MCSGSLAWLTVLLPMAVHGYPSIKGSPGLIGRGYNDVKSSPRMYCVPQVSLVGHTDHTVRKMLCKEEFIDMFFSLYK